MSSSLTCVGVLWACLSIISALASSIAFYCPFWIQGRLLGEYDTYFGSFRRCNFPRLNADSVVEIIQECGRYSTFWTIPTPWWQLSTVLVGLGCGISLLVATTAVAACCISYVLNTGSARLAGSLQLTAAMLICVGVAAYPVGWYTPEIRDACGDEANIFNLGDCQLSWSCYLMSASVGVLLLCVGLSVKASKVKPGSIRL